jgi:hypothetical protein
LGEWRDGAFATFAEAIADGGHTAMTEADARKGAFTNGFKKAAAFFGVGRQAYEGTLDDDSVPADEARVRPAPAQPGRRDQSSSRVRAGTAADNEYEPITELQRRTLFRLAAQRGIAPGNSAGWLTAQLGIDDLKTVSAQEAGGLIEKLQATNGGGAHVEARR